MSYVGIGSIEISSEFNIKLNDKWSDPKSGNKETLVKKLFSELVCKIRSGVESVLLAIRKVGSVLILTKLEF